MINGSDIKVLDAISDIESDVVERYKHDKDFEPFLKLFTKEMETLEGAVTLNMTRDSVTGSALISMSSFQLCQI